MTDRQLYIILGANLVSFAILVYVWIKYAGGFLVFADQILKTFKTFSTDFPTQGGQVVVALGLIQITGIIIAVRLAMGLKFPEGYEDWLIFLGVLSGITNIGMIGKRLTDRKWKHGEGPTETVKVEETTRVESTTTAPPNQT